MSKELDFINFIGRLVVKYPGDFFNSVAIAQACLETGFGKGNLIDRDVDPYLHGNNAFGYKAKDGEWQGEVLPIDSKEELEDGTVIIKRSNFRKYPSVEESVKDHAKMMSRTSSYANHYKEAINAKTPEEQAMALSRTYATDSKYGEKLIEIINYYGLKAWDKLKKGKDNMTTKRLTFEEVAKQVYGTEVINWDGFANVGAPRRSGQPDGAIIHNDYGAANGKGYIDWLRSARIPNPSAGYAHYYIDRQYAMRAVPTYKGAWHAGDYARGNYTGHGKPANYGNMKLIGYEVNQSRHFATTNRQFRLNEEVVFLQVAEDFLFYELQPNRKTVWLHNEFTGTSCPHRSWELHVGVGAPYNQVNRMKLKDYFIGRIQFWMDVLLRKRPIPPKDYLPEEHKEVTTKPETKEKPKTYIVQKGDYLSKIGNMFGLDWKDIKKWNHLETNTIYTGQELVLSPEVYNEKVEKPVEKSTNDSTPKITVKVIKSVNGSENEEAYVLKENQLIMPSGKLIEYKILN